MDRASQQGLTRDFSKLLLFFTETCTIRHKHVKPQKVSTCSAMVDLSSRQHLQQDEYAVKEADAAMRSFMMHRFLRAAADVAAEHESSISPSKQKIVSTSPSPSSPQLSRRMPITCCIKSRAQQVHAFTQHSSQQKDIMPRLRSAFFCLGLETLLFHASRRVKSTSGHFDDVRKRSWVPHPSYHRRVASEGSSEIEGPVSCKEKGDTKHQSERITDVDPLMFGDHVNAKEGRWKHGVKYHAGLLRSKYLGADDGVANTGCLPPSSQSSLADHDACTYEQKHEHEPLPAELRTDELGWPFGMFNSSREAGCAYDKQQEKNSFEKLAAGGKVPCPPLPPAPTESWLGHVVRKNESRTSLLASLQQKEMAALSRSKPRCQSVDLGAERISDCQLERRWEDVVVKGNKPHSRPLRYSEI